MERHTIKEKDFDTYSFSRILAESIGIDTPNKRLLVEVTPSINRIMFIVNLDGIGVYTGNSLKKAVKEYNRN